MVASILLHGDFCSFARYCFPVPIISFQAVDSDTKLLVHVTITRCLLLCETGMPEHGATKSRNKRTRKERWLLLATKLSLLQTSLETSPSCDGQTNGRRAHGWLLLYGSFWSEQQSICKHESCLSGTSHSHLSGTLIHGLTELGNAANTALSQNALRQDLVDCICYLLCYPRLPLLNWHGPFVSWRYFSFAAM